MKCELGSVSDTRKARGYFPLYITVRQQNTPGALLAPAKQLTSGNPSLPQQWQVPLTLCTPWTGVPGPASCWACDQTPPTMDEEAPAAARQG